MLILVHTHNVEELNLQQNKSTKSINKAILIKLRVGLGWHY